MLSWRKNSLGARWLAVVSATQDLGNAMDDLSTLFSLNHWPGHLSYILIAISYWLTDIFRLRVVAVVGLSFEIVYFLMSGGDLRTGIGWDLAFILINLFQLYRLVRDRLSFRLPEKERALLRKA